MLNKNKSTNPFYENETTLPAAAPTQLNSSAVKKVEVSSNPSTSRISEIECETLDMDEEISQQMTQSYSEISFNSNDGQTTSRLDEIDSENFDKSINLQENTNKRPNSLEYEKLTNDNNYVEGTVHTDGNMTYYVAEDLENKIKLSSPISKKDNFSRSSTPNSLYRQILAPQISQVDANVLADLETEAQRIATTIDNLTENLGGILHSISSLTAENIDCYKDAVTKMSDAMDSNIKGMYTIIAKSEEVSKAMVTVQHHAERVKEIKRLVDLLDSNV